MDGECESGNGIDSPLHCDDIATDFTNAMMGALEYCSTLSDFSWQIASLRHIFTLNIELMLSSPMPHPFPSNIHHKKKVNRT